MNEVTEELETGGRRVEERTKKVDPAVDNPPVVVPKQAEVERQ